jgi:site-specific DNA recombinase
LLFYDTVSEQLIQLRRLVLERLFLSPSVSSAYTSIVQKEIKQNALAHQDQGEYKKQYVALAERFNTAKTNLSKVEKKISRKELSRSSIRQFLDTLRKQKDIVTAFDAVQFQSLVDFITVYSKDDIRVTFKNGMEIRS